MIDQNAEVDPNKKTYTSSSIVWHYKQLGLLQPAEQTILDLLKDRLPTMKMLDIGVGGGRTTQHFAPLAETYTGIDYSPEMIAASKQRFANFPHSITLEIGDARKMQFEDNSFDFILFSFNGIDSVSHSDRLEIFKEVRRVGKTGGYFCFSTHNLHSMVKELDWKTKFSLNPLKTYVNLMMLAILKLSNLAIAPNQVKTADHLIIKDEPHNFRLLNYYIQPQAQIKQLANFNHIEIYSWKSGLKISDLTELSAITDMWLYYLCVIG